MFNILSGGSSGGTPSNNPIDDGGSRYHPSKPSSGSDSRYSHGGPSTTPEFVVPSTPTKHFTAGSDCSVNSSISGTTATTTGSHKKRNRRRRKGKSRSKVEPLSSASSLMESPTKNGFHKSSTSKSSHGRSPCASVSSAYSYGGGSSVTTTITNNTYNIYNMSCAGSITSVNSKKHHDAPMTKRDIYFALDCEMVGVGPDGLTSAVGRVSIVNWENQTVLDTYVKVPVPVTDYRTHVSGITAEHLQESNNRSGRDRNHQLMSFDEVRSLVETILRGKILIGHGLENDLKVLGLSHPWTDIRDTATYPRFMREATPSIQAHYHPAVPMNGGLAPKKLRDLAWEQLGRRIQCPGVPHSPMEDAIAALDLYKKVRGQWEDHLITLSRQQEQEQQEQLVEQQRQQQLQLMELQQQQLLDRQRRHQEQQQQQQARRWQWLASNSTSNNSNHRGAFPSGQHPYVLENVQMQQPMMQVAQPAAYYTDLSPTLPVMAVASPSPAASAYLQQHQGPLSSTSQQESSGNTNVMRPSSSWFGFSRRSSRSRGSFAQQNQHQDYLPQTPPSSTRRDFSRQTSRESLATQCTMTMTQSSFDGDSTSPLYTIRSTWSQDCEGFSSSPGGAWQVPHDFGVEEEVDVDQMGGVGDQGEAGASMIDTLNPTLMEDQSETSVTAASATETTVAAQPTDYEPPRYFANPDPEERLSSSSWFKLWGSSSRKQQDSSSKSCGYNSDAEAEDSSEKPTGLFKSRLFSRRASESCMCDESFSEGKKGRSRSMHG